MIISLKVLPSQTLDFQSHRLILRTLKDLYVVNLEKEEKLKLFDCPYFDHNKNEGVQYQNALLNIYRDSSRG